MKVVILSCLLLSIAGYAMESGTVISNDKSIVDFKWNDVRREAFIAAYGNSDALEHYLREHRPSLESVDYADERIVASANCLKPEDAARLMPGLNKVVGQLYFYRLTHEGEKTNV